MLCPIFWCNMAPALTMCSTTVATSSRVVRMSAMSSCTTTTAATGNLSRLVEASSATILSGALAIHSEWKPTQLATESTSQYAQLVQIGEVCEKKTVTMT